ncbi:MAG TPA: phosphatase PAP2 family protein [Trebonia sp.]|nr:phosphatase PAP2 family protein [Trebonia sp.]
MTAMNRRRFLRNATAATAGLVLAPRVLGWQATAAASTAVSSSTGTAGTVYSLLPFIEHYQTNVSSDLTFSSNAAVEILSGFSTLWQTGTAWNNGTVLDAGALYANMLHSVWVTAKRTEDEAKESFIVDRQDQSYDMIGGLGPLARYYYAGSLAVTSITSAPDGIPATQVNDAVPAGSPAGSMTGAGSPASALGAVVTLVTTLRGNYSSGNPAKNTFLYPRPWRMNDDSQVVDTGTVDQYGFPVYQSDVVVAPQLLLQRSLTPASDSGFPSGHTNAFYLAGLAYAYAVPERFQEIIARAMERANYRIVAGMHSSVDVLGGRILGTALAAAILSDPANATVKANARATALAYFDAATGSGDLFAAAHSAGLDTDPYASRELNKRMIQPWWTYVLPRRGPSDVPMTVLSGENSFRGGTVITGGTLVATSPNALGNGPVQVGAAGTLAVTPAPADPASTAAAAVKWAGQGGQDDDTDGTVRIGGTLKLDGTLAVTLGAGTDGPVLAVAGGALLDGGSSLVISLPDGISGRAAIQLLSARQVRGAFGAVSVATSGYSAVVRYARNGVTVLISAA